MAILIARRLLRVACLWLTLFTLLLGGNLRCPAQSAASREYQLKAAFLFNFAQFIDWPPTAFASADAPFRIGIVGNDPFGAVLDETVRGEKVQGHPLVIERYRHAEDVGACQILFVGGSESGQLEKILASVKGKSVLTVGDFDGFLKNGGAMRFVTEQNKIHLRVDLDTAKAAGLTISSKLLRLAVIVGPGKD